MVHHTRHSEQDTKPWYRQFWPWFVILLPASAVVASLYTLSLAIRTEDSLVVDSNRGMDVISAQHIAAARKAESLGLIASITIDNGLISVALQATDKTAATQSTDLALQFSHPAFAKRDQVVLLFPGTGANANVYEGKLDDLPAGRWYLVLESDSGWRLTGVLDASARSATLDSQPSAPGGHDD